MIDEKKLANAAMSEEELDNVAGGCAAATADDSRFLNSLNGSTDRYGATRLLFTGGEADEKICKEIEAGWATVGIRATINTNISRNNLYSRDGTYISQEQARQHAMNVTGHHMPESEWKW